jgi:hypothetical protein
MQISDIDECTPGHVCELCNTTATVAIEWEDELGRRWMSYCDACAKRELSKAAHCVTLDGVDGFWCGECQKFLPGDGELFAMEEMSNGPYYCVECWVKLNRERI